MLTLKTELLPEQTQRAVAIQERLKNTGTEIPVDQIEKIMLANQELEQESLGRIEDIENLLVLVQEAYELNQEIEEKKKLLEQKRIKLITSFKLESIMLGHNRIVKNETSSKE